MSSFTAAFLWLFLLMSAQTPADLEKEDFTIADDGQAQQIAAFSIEPKEGRFSGKLEILFVQQSAADKPPTIGGDAMDVNLKKETYQAALQRRQFRRDRIGDRTDPGTEGYPFAAR